MVRLNNYKPSDLRLFATQTQQMAALANGCDVRCAAIFEDCATRLYALAHARELELRERAAPAHVATKAFARASR